MDDRRISATILERAHKVVTTERGTQHGDAETSFEMIGDLWHVYLRHANARRMEQGLDLNITAFDVAQMMILFKVARSIYGNRKDPEHYVDEAGYAGLAGMLAKAELPKSGLKPGDYSPLSNAALANQLDKELNSGPIVTKHQNINTKA